jgi:uncharacterized protein
MPSSRQDRRTFLRTLAGSALVGCAHAGGWPGRAEAAPALSSKQAAPAALAPMRYRRLGRTGLMVSEISLGSSPLPDETLLRTLIDRGVNYIDTSHNYENGNCERRIGRLVKDVGRGKLLFGTKFHVTPRDTKASIMASVHGSLKRLATEAIDVLLIHGAESPEVLVDERVLGAFDDLEKEGAFRFKGLSCHANHGPVIRKAVECGRYDMVQLGYNVFDIQETEDPSKVESYPDYLGASGIRGLVELARSRDVGVLAMKTLKVGGRRQDLTRYRTGATTLYQAMLKWVLADPNVTSALIEILSHDQMEEDLGAVGAPLTGAETGTLERYVAENGRDYCHGCTSCRRACPSGLATTAILHALAYHESYGKTERAREAYAALEPGEKASGCRDCGACEAACPYGVRVRTRILEADRLLA